MGSRRKFKTVDEYIAAQPAGVQPVLRQIRIAVHEAAPQAQEVISYNMPAVRQNGILVWYAAFKNHIGFFPKTSFMDVFKRELAGYETSKGTVRFPLDQPMPFDLIKKIVKYRVKETATA